jgi:hypothetical protein
MCRRSRRSRHTTLTVEDGLVIATARLSGATVQAPGPPAGSVEPARSRLVSTATHRVTAGQETLLSDRPGSTGAVLQADAPPAGSAEVSTLPAASTATQRSTEGQATLVRPRLGSTGAVAHAAAPPAGSSEVSTSPAPSTATHSDADGHAAAVSGWVSIVTIFHAVVGSLELNTLPAPSTAMQDDSDAHATPAIAPGVPLKKLPQLIRRQTAPTRATDVYRASSGPPATHSVAVGQLTAPRPLSPVEQ